LTPSSSSSTRRLRAELESPDLVNGLGQRRAVRRTRAERSFHIDGWVVLPDHLHCVLTLPPGDDNFSNRIKAIKIRFVRVVEPNERRSSVRIARGERGI
jgi:putative transposase